ELWSPMGHHRRLTVVSMVLTRRGRMRWLRGDVRRRMHAVLVFAVLLLVVAAAGTYSVVFATGPRTAGPVAQSAARPSRATPGGPVSKSDVRPGVAHGNASKQPRV